MEANKAQVINVLMVDDNPDDIELTIEAFRESKKYFKVNVAQNGEEALNFLRKHGEFKNRPNPDLLLLDLNMPRMNGFEVLEEINRDRTLKEIPVIIFSISQNPADMERAKSLNAKLYLVKPVGIEGIVNVVRTIETFVDNNITA